MRWGGAVIHKVGRLHRLTEEVTFEYGSKGGKGGAMWSLGRANSKCRPEVGLCSEYGRNLKEAGVARA